MAKANPIRIQSECLSKCLARDCLVFCYPCGLSLGGRNVSDNDSSVIEYVTV